MKENVWRHSFLFLQSPRDCGLRRFPNLSTFKFNFVTLFIPFQSNCSNSVSRCNLKSGIYPPKGLFKHSRLSIPKVNHNIKQFRLSNSIVPRLTKDPSDILSGASTSVILQYPPISIYSTTNPKFLPDITTGMSLLG